MLKTALQAIAMTLFVVAVLLALCFLCVSYEAGMDGEMWNDGYCPCGGKWEFSNATHIRGGELYYYHCEDCGNTIKTHTPQKYAKEG